LGKGVVFGGDDLPGGFGAPGGILKDVAKDCSGDRHLGIGHEVGLALWQVGAKVGVVFCGIAEDETAAVGWERAAVGMAYEDDGAVLLVDRAIGCGDVFAEAGIGRGGDGDLIAAGFQEVVYFLPAGAVGEGSVDDDDVFDWWVGGLCCDCRVGGLRCG